MKAIVALAVEDDALRMTYAQFGYGASGDEIVAQRVTDIPRTQYAGTGDHSDVDDWYIERILDTLARFIQQCRAAHGRVDAVALSTFGNVNFERATITHAANRGRFAARNNGGEPFVFDVRKTLKAIYGDEKLPKIFLLNDATAAAFGELRFSDNVNYNDAFCYVWLGRGINCGLVLREESWRGYLHPELGHFLPRIHEAHQPLIKSGVLDDNSAPYCVQHRTCLMGLASLRAVKALKQHLPLDTVVEIYAYYIAQLCAAVAYTVAPSRIVADGYIFRSGVLPRSETLDRIRDEFGKIIGAYPNYQQINEPETFIKGSKLDAQNSLRGLIAFAGQQMGIASK